MLTGKMDAKGDTKGQPEDDDQYEPVTGLDKASIECVRAHEEAAAKKTASDYSHVIWAYGVIWSLFAMFGVLLWRRAKAQQADLDELRRRLDRGK